ncbi:MAG: ATP-grasp domain-containing protein, partial [Gammaproteobacteria bacterium]|nr:ATP-grasp domain-containing protein [Gammaproteobacteria bacterium]
AVYSEADAGARHVRLADEAVLLGPAAARESYLRADKIIEVARATGAQAIHPGYGFLSENAEFAEACAAAGIVFIGPPAAAIRAMGSKSAAKALMAEAGVPLTPGYHGDRQEPDFLAGEADAIGYPVLIKASAGGGGKGMRRVDRAGDFAEALASCKREAANAFGDDHVLIEKYVLKPRHIEIQVFADGHGNAVHLHERDCSVQRRHQKVLEEAPAPGMTDERRAAMGRAAVDAARAVGYVGAGTVEFIANPDGGFYFMEMNTRLQVEHPVTEMITGQDLVEWQLRVAHGEALPLAQRDIPLAGHAIEARVYAEDPQAGFLPATGRLVHLAPPAESAHVRVDTGVEQGDVITPWYDPMIAKLIVWDENRDAALARLHRALGDYRVVGVQNNIDFLARLVTSPAFATADLDTALIEREEEHLFAPRGAVPDSAWVLAALARAGAEDDACAARAAAVGEHDNPWTGRDAWRLNGSGGRRLTLRAGDEERVVTVRADGAAMRVDLGEAMRTVQLTRRDGSHLAVAIDGHHVPGEVVVDGARLTVFVAGTAWPLEAIDSLEASGEGEEGAAGLLAPMPGKVISLIAAPGSTVKKGDKLLVLEAMKMEHTICAPADGTVKAFFFDAGEQVTEGAELVDFEHA